VSDADPEADEPAFWVVNGRISLQMAWRTTFDLNREQLETIFSRVGRGRILSM